MRAELCAGLCIELCGLRMRAELRARLCTELCGLRMRAELCIELSCVLGFALCAEQ